MRDALMVLGLFLTLFVGAGLIVSWKETGSLDWEVLLKGSCVVALVFAAAWVYKKLYSSTDRR